MGQCQEPPCDRVDRLGKEAGARIPIRCRRGNPRDAGACDRGTCKKRMVARRPSESRRNASGSPGCYGRQVPRFGLANGRYLCASPLATVLSPIELTAGPTQGAPSETWSDRRCAISCTAIESSAGDRDAAEDATSRAVGDYEQTGYPVLRWISRARLRPKRWPGVLRAVVRELPRNPQQRRSLAGVALVAPPAAAAHTRRQDTEDRP